MKLHNTLTRQPEDFKPTDNTQVRIYSCGPTVYDHIHIGNLSAFIYADTLRRTLRAAGYDVRHVMNFTDVDDKTIRRSRERYPDLAPEEALHKLTAEYSDIFLADMETIGNDVSALEFIRATDSIEGMRRLIEELHTEDFAYITEDGVYFSIEKYRASGKKYGQLTEISEASTANARIQNDEYDKDFVHDFALWKTRKEGEPAWPFELDGHDLTGRPGWHIECSVMSVNLLGQPFDIHTGGIDLIFPHHENEIAQSTAGKGDAYAKYFFHNEHLLVDGKKMSKSLGNFYTLRDIQEKGYDPLAFRLMVLQSHYRSQTNFSWENLEAAQNRLKTFWAMADLRFQAVEKPSIGTSAFDSVESEIMGHLTNDVNGPNALAVLNAFESLLKDKLISKADENRFDKFLRFLDNILGLDLSGRDDITNEQKELIAARQAAREAKDWAKSDEQRDELQKQGIAVRDTEHGPVWSKL